MNRQASVVAISAETPPENRAYSLTTIEPSALGAPEFPSPGPSGPGFPVSQSAPPLRTHPMKIHVTLVPIPPPNPTGPDLPGTVY